MVIVMGVAGSGKTVIGRALAATLGWRFVDADDYHSKENIAKMRSGQALTDADRAPWLAALHALVARTLDRREHLVLACSALKERYRVALRGGLRQIRFVYLAADEAILRERLAGRRDHFARPNLLPSQLAALEPPSTVDAVTVDASQPPDRIVQLIRCDLGV